MGQNINVIKEVKEYCEITNRIFQRIKIINEYDRFYGIE